MDSKPTNKQAQKADAKPKQPAVPLTPEEKRKGYAKRANKQIANVTRAVKTLEKMQRSRRYESTEGQRRALIDALNTLHDRAIAAVEGVTEATAPVIPDA